MRNAILNRRREGEEWKLKVYVAFGGDLLDSMGIIGVFDNENAAKGWCDLVKKYEAEEEDCPSYEIRVEEWEVKHEACKKVKWRSYSQCNSALKMERRKRIYERRKANV